MAAVNALSPGEPFRPTLHDFADRIVFIRCLILRKSVAEVARHIGVSDQTVSNWEAGTTPHKFPQVVDGFYELVHQIEPAITWDWIARGGGETDRLVTYWDAPAVVENAQERLPIQLPPAKHSPTLAVVE